MGARSEAWQNFKYVLPVVLCFMVPIVTFAVLVPLAHTGEASSARSPQPTTIEVGSREAEFRQAVSTEFTLDPGGNIASNVSGRLTAIAVNPGDSVTAGIRLFDIDGSPVFAMPQSLPLYRDLSYGDEGADVAALQEFLVATGYLLDVDGEYGTTTANAVCSFQTSASMSCTGVFAIRNVAYVPPSIQTIGDLLKETGDTITQAEAVIVGAKAAVAVRFSPNAENADLSPYKNQPIVLSTSSGSELTLPGASGLTETDIGSLDAFIQAAVSSGDVTTPEPSKVDSSTGSQATTYNGLILRKKDPEVVAVIPGNSVLATQNGGGCVVAVDGERLSFVKLKEIAPAVGELGQVFTDASLIGLTILRNPADVSRIDAECA